MNTTNAYQEFIRSAIANAVNTARATAKNPHQGIKGAILEILISQLFRPLLPSDIGVGTGQIIEQKGTLSPQIDIVLYDRSILPPALYDDKVGIFPVEAVLYAIEIKTKLTASELKKSHVSAAILDKFKYLPGKRDEHDIEINHHFEKLRSVVFALNSDLRGTRVNEAERYEKIYKGLNQPPFIRAICVAGKEYWFDDGACWLGTKEHNLFDEVLSFIGGVTNTYREVAKSRHSPLLGQYIIPSGTAKAGPPTGVKFQISLTCQTCGEKIKFAPDMPKNKKIVVEGTISHTQPCEKCGGILRSPKGTFEFENGKLKNMALLTEPNE